MQGWVTIAKNSLEGLEAELRSTNFEWMDGYPSELFDRDLEKPTRLAGPGGMLKQAVQILPSFEAGCRVVTEPADPVLYGESPGLLTRGLYLGRIVYEKQHLSSGTGSARRWARESVQRAALRWRELCYARTDQTPPPGPQVQPVVTRETA